jgi:hypothetical protein
LKILPTHSSAQGLVCCSRSSSQNLVSSVHLVFAKKNVDFSSLFQQSVWNPQTEKQFSLTQHIS